MPESYRGLVRKFGPEVEEVARERYGISGESLMAKMLKGESNFSEDMGTTGPSTPFGNARGPAQFIPSTRQDMIEKFGIDPWRSKREAVAAMAKHLDGRSYGRGGIEGYNPGKEPSYYLNQDVGESRRNPKAVRQARGARGQLKRVEVRAEAANLPGVAKRARVVRKRASGASARRGAVYPLGRKGELIGSPHSGTHTLGNWQSDNAVDISVPDGTAVRSMGPGVVEKVSGGYSGGSSRFDGFQVTVRFADGNRAFYTHLSRADVQPGDKVGAGSRLGLSGSANGVPHLHLGVERGDPRELLSGGVIGGGSGPVPSGGGSYSGGGGSSVGSGAASAIAEQTGMSVDEARRLLREEPQTGLEILRQLGYRVTPGEISAPGRKEPDANLGDLRRKYS